MNLLTSGPNYQLYLTVLVSVTGAVDVSNSRTSDVTGVVDVGISYTSGVTRAVGVGIRMF